MMARSPVILLDSFCAVEEPPLKHLTYETLKAAVLRAGRFSVFEASARPRSAVLYSRLHHDPTITLTDLGYPWTGVRALARKGVESEGEGCCSN
jgi:hypothetical protein